MTVWRERNSYLTNLKVNNWFWNAKKTISPYWKSKEYFKIMVISSFNQLVFKDNTLQRISNDSIVVRNLLNNIIESLYCFPFLLLTLRIVNVNKNDELNTIVKW